MRLFSLFIIIISLFNQNALSQASWIQRADFGSNGRHRGTAITIGNKGYMGLGHYNGAGPNIVKADWWEYDPSTNAWVQKADYNGNGASGNYAVLSFGMANAGYVGGGQVAVNASFHKYTPATNTWTPVASSPTIPMNTQGFVVGDKGYYLSGNAVYQYDSSLDIWTVKNSAPFSVGAWNSTFTIDDKAYVKTSNSLWEYKPSLDQWFSRASFPGLATSGSASFTQYSKGYVVTGFAGFLSEVVSEVWEYDPGTNQWAQLSDFLGSNRRFSSAFSVGERCFIGIGTNGTNFNDLWEFDALANLEEMFDINQFTCYPNPADEFINFRSKNLKEFNVLIYNNAGQRIASLATYDGFIKFRRDNYMPGLYFYEVLAEGTIVHKNKFIFN